MLRKSAALSNIPTDGDLRAAAPASLLRAAEGAAATPPEELLRAGEENTAEP
ncbi:MAG TPA: hypothetical protein VKT77_07810 [Chthonomonadaceae bacterium]|nr:hypothetical protein [Chthonomonadaceae bacterium]